MISKKMEAALNRQINAELYSAYLYLSMNSYFNSINLPGFANWMRIQALEEMTHADKFYKYVTDRGGRVVLDAIERPPAGWNSPLGVFEQVYKHEQKVTSLIHALVDLAIKEKDHATNAMLQWFVNEQVEEESNADTLVQQLRLIGDNGYGILMLDRELARRVFTPPVQSQE
ncbi:MAG TPA: ferritin [Deltaproteobacteria bacterium]|nr:ferritin [Deltaproteobacteria bacterium]HPR53867.1 ferritin [Deltaproteobacteria bacterium]HXK45933.1 ferritin [Deltaproteobacteria bacterium]